MQTLIRIANLSSSMQFWRTMFFILAATFIFYCANPRVVVKSKHIYLIMDHDANGEPVIVESEAI